MAVDHAGHALTAGMVVKLEATILSIDDTNTHYANVVISPIYPTGLNTVTGAVPAVNVDNTGPVRSNPQTRIKLAVDGTNLTYVSG